MSFILSALKRADDERRIGHAPSLLEETPAAPAPRARNKAGGPLIAAFAGLALVNLLLFQFGDRWFGGADAPAPPAAAQAVVQEAAPVAVQAVQPPQAANITTVFTPTPASPPITAVITPVPTPALSPAPEAAPALAAEPAAIARPAQPPPQIAAPRPAPPLAPEDAIMDYAELPAAVKQDMPEMRLSGHLYSASNPKARMIVINGRRLRENEWLGEVRVDEVTAAGVVVDFEGWKVRLDADALFR